VKWTAAVTNTPMQADEHDTAQSTTDKLAEFNRPCTYLILT